MFSKAKNTFYLLFFIIFMFLTVRFYFSEQNIRAINETRSFYSVNLNESVQNVPILKNDTENVIEYTNNVEIKKKKKKYPKFWDLIKKKTK